MAEYTVQCDMETKDKPETIVFHRIVCH